MDLRNSCANQFQGNCYMDLIGLNFGVLKLV